MKIGLLGGSSPSQYVNANAQKTINWIPVVSGQSEEDKSQVALHARPGLTVYTTLPGTNPRGLFTARTHLFTRCFAVVDTTLYEILTNSTYAVIGSLSNLAQGASRVVMECNLTNELFIGGYTASYVYNMVTGVLTQVTDVDFPNNVESVTYLDQYMIVAANGAVFESEVTEALNWSSVQSYSPTFRSAPVIAVGALREQIFNFTTETIEVFVNDGSSPYSRLPRTSLRTGILSKNSLATSLDGFIYVGKSLNGQAQVFYYDGWNPPTVISDKNITYQLNRGVSLADTFGYLQQTKDNQKLYYLTIPSLQSTFVFNFTSGKWCEFRSTNPSKGSDGSVTQDCFRGAFYTNFNDMNIFLDRYSGTVFKEDYNNFTDNNNIIKRERISQIIHEEDKYISVEELILDCSVGLGTTTVTPVLFLSWSYDGGYTYNDPQPISLGSMGQYDFVTKIVQLGMGRRWVFKITYTDQADLMIQDAYIQATPGTF